MRTFLLVFLSFLFLSSKGIAQKEEHQAIFKTLDTFIEAIDQKDSITFNSLFLDKAYAYSVITQEGQYAAKSTPLEANFGPVDLKERLDKENSVIEQRGAIAFVMLPYEFWIDGKHSHCGEEIFTLVKQGKEWKIASLTYSIRREDCKSK